MGKPTLLITGGTGYIGSHAVVAFEQAGYKTVILDNLTNSSRDVLTGIEKILGYCPDFSECDIRDRDGLEKIFLKYEFDGVMHFAGLKAVQESCQKIGQYHENNITGSICLFDVMEQYGVNRIVFSSSATVYAGENPLPWQEDMDLASSNPYGTSKIVIEQLLQDYAKNKDWAVTCLRYFNPIGAHESGYIGENPQGVPNNLLPHIFHVVLGKSEYLHVYGIDYDTPDGSAMRDYIDINDLIYAHILSYQNAGGYTVYNVGNGNATSVFEMLHRAESVVGKTIPYKIGGRRQGDLPIFYADATKIRLELGWYGKIGMEQSIQSAWNFIKRKVE